MSAVTEVLTQARRALTGENLIAAIAIGLFVAVIGLWAGVFQMGVML